MKEMYALAQLLSDIGAEYTFKPLFDGYQIILYKNGERVNDAIWHSFSLGFSEGLLETYWEDDVKGYLTATEVFDHWEKEMMD